MKFRTKVLVFLNNTELLLDIKSILMLVVAVILPLLYFLYSDNFSMDGLLNFQFGVLALFVIIGNFMTWFETSTKAERDEREENKELQDEIQRTKDKQATLPKKIDTIIDFNKYYNEQKQINRNKQLTNLIIGKLNNKINKLKIKEKPYSHIEQDIIKLEETPLFDKSYKSVKIENIISIEKKTKDQIEGNDSVQLNPRMYGWKGFVIKQPIKALSIGGSGMFILGLNQDGLTVFIFYLIYILTLALLIALRYPFVRRITKTLYCDTLINKQKYIDEYHEWYNQDINIDWSGKLDIDNTVKL